MPALNWKAVVGPLADVGVAYFEANEAALAPMITAGEARLEVLFAAFLAKVFVSKNPFLGPLESELAKAFEGQATALIAEYGASAAILAMVDKGLHEAAAAVGG